MQLVKNRRVFEARENCKYTAFCSFADCNVRCNISPISGKNKNVKVNHTEKPIQPTQTKLENLVQNMVANAVKPLKAEINTLKAEVNALRESQQFISNQNDDLNKSYKSAVLSNK